MSRRKPVRALFLADVFRSSLVKDGARVLLVCMATITDVDPAGVYGGHAMTDDGKVKVSREELAEALGITVKEVSNRIAEAVKAGLLVKGSGGRNGQVAGYTAHPRGCARGIVKPTAPESLAALLAGTLAARKGCVVGTPVGVPRTGSEDPVGTPVGAPYARAHYLQNSASKNHTTAESRVDREDDATGKGGTNRDEWIPAPSRRPSYRPVEGEVAS